MKKIVFLNILAAVILLPIFAQADFSGSADISLIANMPDTNGFSSMLSRADLGIEDFTMMSALIAKLDAGDENT